MESIKRFFECLVPITKCNLRCSYCYAIQQGRRESEIPPFAVSPETIGKAFSKKRVGGIAFISLCGVGETLIPPEMPYVIFELLKQGHYINVTNNGTMTDRFQQIVALCPPEYLSRLSFAFSLHYIELKKKNMLGIFIKNVQFVKEHGCSILVQMNWSDEYMPVMDEIKAMCKHEFGAYPQVALTRSEAKDGYRILTEYSEADYIDSAKSFRSPLFDFTYKNFNVKRKEFCYAGVWTYKVNLGTGDLMSCDFAQPHQNIYQDIQKPFRHMAIGTHCQSDYCVNSSHYLSLGSIPEIEAPTYCMLRDRPEAGWYQPNMKVFLSHKLSETNPEYTPLEKILANTRQRLHLFAMKIQRKYRKLLCVFKSGC